MPGAYAHITAVLELAVKPRLKQIPDFPDDATRAVLRWVKYCEMGAVSPDFPYLAATDLQSTDWSNRMHWRGSGDAIKAGIERVKILHGEAKEKGFAWLLGYASHVAMDVTIHPVINLKVGPYEENKAAHRTCEMHQDVYIYRRLALGPLYLADQLAFFKPSRFRARRDPGMDRDVKGVWREMLQKTYPGPFEEAEPRIDDWYRWYHIAVDLLAEEATLVPIARHVGVKLGLVYPRERDLDSDYLEQLETPNGRREDYDTIFDLGKQNIALVWGWIGAGVFGGSSQYLARFSNWNLDTGLDEDGGMVLWA